MIAMSAHAVVPDVDRQQGVLEAMNAAMREFGIAHVTVQLERSAIPECDELLHR
jgi:Co/Zn/Cd efflux system component